MPLIQSTRYTETDLELWSRVSRQDPIHCQLGPYKRRVQQAGRALIEFAAQGRCYASVSWGKDSTVLAHLVSVYAPEVPVVHIDLYPIGNPDSPFVRDAFLCRHPIRYHEVRVAFEADGADLDAAYQRYVAAWYQALDEAQSRFGDRYILGLRGSESSKRKSRMRNHGISTDRTCSPIGWWTAADVWAYLFEHDLPIHPAYACGISAGWERDRIRVEFIGMEATPVAWGAREWDMRYYGTEIGRIITQRDPRIWYAPSADHAWRSPPRLAREPRDVSA